MTEEDEDRLILTLPIPFSGKELCLYVKSRLTRKDYVLLAAGWGFMIAAFCIFFCDPVMSIGALISTLGLYELGKIFGLVNEC